MRCAQGGVERRDHRVIGQLARTEHRYRGWQGDLFRFMFNTKLEQYNWAIVQEDKVILEAMPPWPAAENLYQHDIGPARVRRYVRDEARKQLEAGASAATALACAAPRLETDSSSSRELP